MTDTKTFLTLDRIYASEEFSEKRIGNIVWSTKSPSYFALEQRGNDGGEQSLFRVDIATGEKTIVADAANLTPAETGKPLKVDSFTFSADESKILLFANTKRVWRYNTRGDYWLFDRNARTLTKLGGDGAPASMMFAKFSPDSSKVAFVRDANIFIQQLDDLAVRAVTTDGSDRVINGTADWVNEEELALRDCYRFSPDGQSILFWQFDTEGVGVFHMLDNTAGTYPRLVSFPYPKVGEPNSSTRLGIVSAGGGEVTWLQTPGDPREHYIPQAEWSPDGARILVQQMNRLQNANRVMLFDPRSGVRQDAFVESDEAWLENENPVRWTSDSKSLVWLSERSGWRHAYKAHLDGTAATAITLGEFDVVDIVAVDEADGRLYFIASPENATQRYLYRASLAGGDPERLSPADQPGWHAYEVSPDTKWAVHTWSSFASPPTTELIRMSDHSVVRVLEDNQHLRDKLTSLFQPTHEFFRVDVGDGIEVDGWCLKPPGFEADNKYPLLVHVYGEPHGTTVTDSWKGNTGLWHWMLAQQGCMVVSVDNRGTKVPRGRAWRKCVYRQVGIIAPVEQAAALKAIQSKWPCIDSSRVGIWGWSGGGSMSLNAIFRYPDLYQTAIAVAPNANQLLYDTIYQERYMGLPSDNADNYREGSPITHALRLQGNLLVVHGTGDDNGHFQGTEFLMNELVKHGKHFSVMPYPHRSHSIREGENTVRHFWGYLTRYLQDHLIGDAATTVPQ